MKKVISRKLTPKQAAELRALAKLAEKGIDTKSIPEVRDWRGAKRGVFFRPVKQQLTLRLDADVIAWFKERADGGKGYQSDINRALRAYVGKQSRRRAS
jgi:uncharacterized protein (DUF4415 family)